MTKQAARVVLSTPEDGHSNLLVVDGDNQISIRLSHAQLVDIVMRGHEALYRWYRAQRAKSVS